MDAVFRGHRIDDATLSDAECELRVSTHEFK